MKKNILEEIKNTDNKIKKVFNEFLEQGRKTSQLLQTSYEQLKTSSFNHNNSKSLNISHDITLEGGKNDDSKEIKLTYQSSPGQYLKDLMSTKENQEQIFTQNDDMDSIHKKNNNKFDISQDTEDLLKSQDDLDIDFPLSLRQMNLAQSTNLNQNQQISQLQSRRLSQNSLRTSMESLNDDSLLSSLHNNSIFDGSQYHQQVQQYSQNNNNILNNTNKHSTKQKSYDSQENKKSLKQCLKIRETEIDFGKQFIFQEVTKVVEVLNTSDQQIKLKIYFESDQFQLNNNYITISEFSAAKIIIKCYKEEEQRVFDSLQVEEDCEHSDIQSVANDCITILVKAQLMKPQLIIKSDQNMFIQQQFTTIEAKLNDLGEICIYLTNPLTDLQQEVEIDVVQKQNDSTKITFFPQNLIIKQQETKKVSFTISNRINQNGVSQVFCVFFKVNSTPIIFAAKVKFN